MNKSKKARLERKGWKTGNADEFLGLSPEESRFVELKLALSRSLRERREARKLTQADLARQLRSSQSRIAKMEAGDPSVSLDLLFRSLFFLGVTKRDLTQIIGSQKHPRAA
jgi:DNA-binding XRE family transcriptional regulator